MNIRFQEELEKARGDAAKQRASKRVVRIKEQLRKLKIQRTDKVNFPENDYLFILTDYNSEHK